MVYYSYDTLIATRLNVHAPIPVGQTGVTLFKASQSGTYIFYCTPHYGKATGEGMKGTLIVEQ